MKKHKGKMSTSGARVVRAGSRPTTMNRSNAASVAPMTPRWRVENTITVAHTTTVAIVIGCSRVAQERPSRANV